MKNFLLFSVTILVSAFSGYYLHQYLIDRELEEKMVGNPVLNQPAQEFAMSDLDGKLRNITEWKGKVVLLNFWATWCPPCLREIPDFIDLQTQYKQSGFQILGVAMDNLEAVKTFTEQMEINYPVFPGDAEVIGLARRYGNKAGALPYSVFIDREGVVTHTIMGELDKIKAEKILKSLISKP